MKYDGVENKSNAGTGRGRNLQQKGEFEYFDYRGDSYATGCKASGMLNAGELTLGETSYAMSSSAGKGTRSPCAVSSTRWD
jgi:hypothetical protein